MIPAGAGDLISQHGTRVRYSTYGCRCKECTAANRAHDRELRRQLRAKPKDPNDPRHGTVNFHNAHGCRCEKCVKVYNDYMREYMRKRAKGKR